MGSRWISACVCTGMANMWAATCTCMVARGQRRAGNGGNDSGSIRDKKAACGRAACGEASLEPGGQLQLTASHLSHGKYQNHSIILLA